jgi:glucose/mannose-6-phosphate isomerase
MADLDAPDLYERIDPAGMRGRIAALPAQARAAWAEASAWPLPVELRARPARVLVLGMGGSAIGADVVAALATATSAVPVQLIRNYTLPPVDPDTLVVACSFSGETEETLDGFRAALAAPCRRLAITTGGTLARIAEEAGAAVFRYRWDGAPRTAFGYGVFPLLAFLTRAGVLTTDERAVATTFDGLDADAAALQPAISTAMNPAKQLATWLYASLPVIAGADVLEVAARRWAGQIAENAEQWAFATALPELNHNLIVGFGAPAGAVDLIRAVVLDGAGVHHRNRHRAALTADALREAGVTARLVSVPGASALETVVRACYLGDWVSLYLAALNGVDPSTMEPIDRLKAALARIASS